MIPDDSTDVVFKSPKPLLQPGSIAIVGASERAKWPNQIYKNLLAVGYPGKIFPVNPKTKTIWGVECYPDLASLPEPPQHAVVIVPAAAVQGVLEVGVAAGLKSATVYAAQIGEGHDEVIVARGRALKSLLDSSDLVLCGPNCMGANSLREKYFGYPASDLCGLTPGPVAFVSQSGGTVNYLVRTAAQRGVNFNYMVSSGNEISLDLADYINFFVESEDTKIIALFIEGIRRPKAFMAAAAKALQARKPIIVIKTGKSQKSREAAQSHTGAISGDYDVFSAMCERYGIVNCATLDDMVETLLAFQNSRLPKGPRVGWVTTSGGTVDLLFDYLDQSGKLATPEYSADTKTKLRTFVSAELAIKNPLDAGDPPNDAGSATMCATVAADPNVDIIAWGSTNFRGDGKRDPTPFKTMFENTQKPVIGFSRMSFATDQRAVDFQAEVGFPFLQGLPQTVDAISALCFYGARVGRRIEPIPAPQGASAALQEAGVEALLAKSGIALPKSIFARSPAEAASLSAEVGYPVALKIVSADIVHKTEAGAVRLNLGSAADVEREAVALISSVQKVRPDARIDGFLVQEMVSGVEVILGARTDPLYGPMIVVGWGGTFVELIRDLAFRLLPVGPDEGRAMIEELKLEKLLAGFRGQPAADKEALVKAICGLSEFYLNYRHQLQDVEINPLIVCAEGKGVRAVDIRSVISTTV